MNIEHEYIYNKQSILEQFRFFCKENQPQNLETAIEFFAIFGGLNRKIDTQDTLISQIKIHILQRYKYLRNDISAITKGYNDSHRVLSALALGDRRTNSAFKRCKMSFDNGISLIDEQCDFKMLKLENSFTKFTKNTSNKDISQKLIFTTPFASFWFAFVSPVFKSVRDGDFKESITIFENNKSKFISFMYEQLSHEMLKVAYKDDEIKQLGRYWDNSDNVIDILAKTKSGKTIAGVCKYTTTKVSKKELNKLMDTCENLGIKVDIFVMYSKKGFSSELKSLKCDSLRLYKMNTLKTLLG